MLEVDNIEKYYGSVQILYGVYLKAEEGEITGILGSNGCGKSTLLKIIFGSLKSKYKLIKVDGTVIRQKLYATGIVKYLPQHNFIPEFLSIRKALQLYDVSETDFHDFFVEENFNLSQKFGNLSGGQRRIAEVFLTLKTPSRIILLDEPFSHISPVQVEAIKQLMQVEKQHKMIVITDHLYREITEVSDVIYLIKNGSSKRIEKLTELEDYKYISVGSL
ncbi:ATP-binding cassette domain-containing protein [Kordia algicida OT-1]|uniref:ABC transporter ATP-binding protein n=1 Tax=Kordia algicida OT-1 TaxID=391587 RepID=A9DM18_9FLAO|nr:ATP-binding cassette domain-containing protein [Kordia algicida]EDP97613.1 ABC transporter ATP-binding protein [Kordia algicida OT-1]